MRLRCGVLVLAVVGLAATARAQPMNGFDLREATIDTDEVYRGGPPRDGIPSIDAPNFLPVGEVEFLQDDDVVIGVVRGGQARAYPTRILIWHEIVNDAMGRDSFAVTYCPLCGTAMVFDRNAGGRLRTFGVSGLLYRSDVLMYDRETNSLWSQIGLRAVSGPANGTSLDWQVSEHMTWAAWRATHPDGQVLSTDTGYQRDYTTSPYQAYLETDAVMFPVPRPRRELDDKVLVLGVVVDGRARAWPLADLPDGRAVHDRVGDTPVIVRWDAARRHPQVTRADGTSVPSVLVFWFAWAAFFPETGLWGSDPAGLLPKPDPIPDSPGP
jgi:hypothetical protein